jgi:hypothetical protein
VTPCPRAIAGSVARLAGVFFSVASRQLSSKKLPKAIKMVLKKEFELF